MNLQEAQARLKKTTITEEQLWQINSIYCLLDFHKDDFCKLIDAIGLDKWVAKQAHYERLDKAEQELTAKEKYLKALDRLEELEREKRQLESVIKGYKSV